MKRSKILSVFLTACLLVSLVPAMLHDAHAADYVCAHDGEICSLCGYDTTADHASHDGTWTPWNGSSMTLTDGKYYLTGPVDTTATVTIDSGTVWLCLAGNAITNNNTSDYVTVITVNDGATLNLCDCVGGGKVTGGNGEQGGGVCNLGTLALYSGEISDNVAEMEGGGVYNYGTFDMYGGAITNNEAQMMGGGGVLNFAMFTMYGGEISGNETGTMGGGVYSYEAVFTMYGGTISGNNAYMINGGVYSGGAYDGGVYGFGTFNMRGGTISGNTDTLSGSFAGVGVGGYSTFALQGAPVIGDEIDFMGDAMLLTAPLTDGTQLSRPKHDNGDGQGAQLLDISNWDAYMPTISQEAFWANNGVLPLPPTDPEPETPSDPMRGNVYGQYVAGGTIDVISVDIEWNSMRFAYSSEAVQIWIPEEHDYSGEPATGWTPLDKNGDLLTITNHSNVDVEITPSAAPTKNTVTITFDEVEGDGDYILQAGVENQYENADYLMLAVVPQGSLSESDATLDKIADITITIAKYEAP